MDPTPMCITRNPNYFHHLQQYVAIENPIRIMKYAMGIAKNIFIIEISKIHRFNFLSAIMFNIVTTGKSINFQPLHTAPITPHIAEIHPMVCLIT